PRRGDRRRRGRLRGERHERGRERPLRPRALRRGGDRRPASTVLIDVGSRPRSPRRGATILRGVNRTTARKIVACATIAIAVLGCGPPSARPAADGPRDEPPPESGLVWTVDAE